MERPRPKLKQNSAANWTKIKTKMVQQPEQKNGAATWTKIKTKRVQQP